MLDSKKQAVQEFHIYKLQIEPEIPDDFRRLKRFLLY